MRPVIPGIYVPLPTFFQDDEELGQSIRVTLHWERSSIFSRSRQLQETCTMYWLSRDVQVLRYLTFLLVTAKAGVLPVVCGSMGEAVHLVRIYSF